MFQRWKKLSYFFIYLLHAKNSSSWNLRSNDFLPLRWVTNAKTFNLNKILLLFWNDFLIFNLFRFCLRSKKFLNVKKIILWREKINKHQFVNECPFTGARYDNKLSNSHLFNSLRGKFVKKIKFYNNLVKLKMLIDSQLRKWFFQSTQKSHIARENTLTPPHIE